MGLTQEEPEERRCWLYQKLNFLWLKGSRDGKPSLVDIARFLDLPIAYPEGGWIHKPDIIPNIMDKLIGNLPDSSASASAPAIGFVVAI